MHKFRFFLNKILYPACVIFTALWILICGLIDAIMDTVNINFFSGLMCFFIALAISLCNLILTKASLSAVARYFLHLLSSITSISVNIAIFSAFFKTKYVITGNSFYLVLVLIVCYLVIATPILLLYFKKQSKKNTNSDYQPMFRK